MHKTSAWPLALTYTALIVFASLFPFDGWREQGIDPLVFLFARIPPPYWTGFDVVTNLVGYAPLGFLLVLGLLRSGWRHVLWAVALATLAGTLLSLCMEFLQIYLPRRVPLDRWSDFRARWFVSDASGGMVLLALWPLALLFPAAVPFGLGQVLERLEAALIDLLADTPFLEWLPLRETELDPLSPSGELLCVTLGLLIPCLLGYCVIRQMGRRALFALAVVGVGIVLTALSAALSWGPVHAWEWMDLPVRVGVWAALGLALLMMALPRRACAAVLLLALTWHLALLNQAPTSAYFAQTLQIWEQGRFIRFYGLGQWLGWLWPYVTLLYVVFRVSRRDAGA